MQLSSRRFIKDAINLIVRIGMKLLICHIKERKCTFFKQNNLLIKIITILFNHSKLIFIKTLNIK